MVWKYYLLSNRVLGTRANRHKVHMMFASWYICVRVCLCRCRCVYSCLCVRACMLSCTAVANVIMATVMCIGCVIYGVSVCNLRASPSNPFQASIHFISLLCTEQFSVCLCLVWVAQQYLALSSVCITWI